MIIIEEQEIIEDWFPEGLFEGTFVIPSENRFRSNHIALEFLKHYVKHSNSRPDADWKLLLIDNHGSLCTPDFMILTDQNHICFFPLIPHFTHCMQPFDVRVFQPYKHWHDVAIQKGLLEFQTEYKLSQFFGDLTKIQDNTCYV